ncbi:hypothetical protein Y032_0044g1086 [Ancylostoma ceylanicum]|uniref:Tc1-like transposase DDE domain-containing protein n=1 Tax=Ancylostoma ceylanicum TaxID=53326 RepID=A0A016UF90_9BILA|nr:hypothetical protein Y032_0044g1086 [Ancylostoma ceylanicum]
MHPNFIVQQDWALAHLAKTTTHFPESKISFFLTEDLWPPNSPDLNPLDFSAWEFMDEILRSRNVRTWWICG